MASASTSSAYTSPPPASPSLAAPAAGPSKAANPTEPPRPILETTWHALSQVRSLAQYHVRRSPIGQTPPPSLREILGAYNAKGEGDRDMLVALLNAKSAEDQRLAAIATLHQTVLQMQHALAIAAVTAQSQNQAQAQAQSPPARAPQPSAEPTRRKRSHAEYAPDAYRLHPYHDRERERGEPPLPPSPDSSASASSPRADFPHLTNPGSMSIRTLLHPSKRRRESGGYDERERERAYDERDRYEEREYRVRDSSMSRRPHVVVHPPSVERDSRYAMRTSSARDEAVEPAGRSP